MKKIEAYVKAERLKDVLDKLKEMRVPGYTYYNVTGHGKEYKEKTVTIGMMGGGVASIIDDILPRTKIEVVCDDSDAEKIVDAIRGGCCTMKSGDGMAFVSTIDDAYRLRSKEKVAKIE